VRALDHQLLGGALGIPERAKVAGWVDSRRGRGRGKFVDEEGNISLLRDPGHTGLVASGKICITRNECFN